MSETRLTKSNVLGATEMFFELASAHDAEPLAAALRPAVEAYKTRAFRLVVVGEIKKGKSSFVNALLNAPGLLPVETGVATSTAYEVCYGDTEKCTVHFNPPVDSANPTQREAVASREIPLGDVATYGTETGNPGNEKEVDVIQVQLPNPRLRRLVLIDTPGLGGLKAAHADITWKQASRADAFCFVLDSVESVVSLPELAGFSKFLAVPEKSGVSRPPFFFVQTKTDAAPDAWESCRERNLESLSTHFDTPPEALRYFPVSSTLKARALEQDNPQFLADSGFPALLGFLDDTLLPETEESEGRLLLQAIGASVETKLQTPLTKRQAVFSQDVTDSMKQSQAQVQQLQSEFDDWQKNQYPDIRRDFGFAFDKLQREAVNRLQNELSPRMGTIITSIIEQVEREELGVEELTEKSDELLAECVDQCDQLIREIWDDYSNGVEALCRKTAEELKTSAPGLDLPDYESETSEGIFEVSSSDRLSTVRATMGGALLPMSPLIMTSVLSTPLVVTGVLTQSAAAMFAGFLAIPAVPIAAVLAYRSYRTFKKDERARARGTFQGFLTETVGKIQVEAVQQFKEIEAESRATATKFLDGAVKVAAQELAAQAASLKRAQQMSSKERSEEGALLKNKLDGVTKFLADIKKRLGMAPKATFVSRQ